MNKALLRKSERIYDWVLQLYPKSYRQEFGKEMQYVFSESLKDAHTDGGTAGIIIIWGRTFIDTATSLVTQHLENRTRSLTSKRRDERKGGESMTKSKDLIMNNKVFLWIAAGTAVILSLPYLAMQFDLVKPNPSNPLDQGVNWTISDFIVMGMLLFGMGSLFVFTARRVPKKYRIFTGIAFVFLLLYIWAELAVGIFTTLGS